MQFDYLKYDLERIAILTNRKQGFGWVADVAM